MSKRNRNVLAAMLAAALLVVSGLSTTALAQHGKPSPLPHASAKPTHGDNGNHGQKNDVVCVTSSPAPSSDTGTSAPTSAATTAPSAPATPEINNPGKSGVTWGWKMGAPYLRGMDKMVGQCNDQSLVGAGHERLARLIATLQAIRTYASTIGGLTPDQQTALLAEIDAAIADLQGLQTKIQSEAKPSDVHTDLAKLSDQAFLVRAIVLQVRLIAGTEQVLSDANDLSNKIPTLQAEIASAPAGSDTTHLNNLLADLQKRVTEAQTLATPLVNALLGLTTDQLSAGKSDPTLAGALKTYWQAAFDIFKAKQDARLIKILSIGPTASEPVVTPTPIPTVTAAAS
jgi:hypothetical protein